MYSFPVAVPAQRAIPLRDEPTAGLRPAKRSPGYLKTAYLKRLTQRNSAPYTVRQSQHLSSFEKTRDV